MALAAHPSIHTQQNLIDALEGETDLAYLTEHFPRFLKTYELCAQRWHWQQAKVLDVGAHWLHQSVLLSALTQHITALDRPETLRCEGVVQTARRHRITLMEIDDLAQPRELAQLDENSLDVIVFSEILEHLTFNPLPMWKAFYRVLRPGGRIILTTPNHYGSAALLRNMSRWVTGGGSGISVEHILAMPTSRPHWKEYSISELRQYFGMISADFHIGCARQVSFHNGASFRWQRRALNQLERFVRSLRNGLYMEIDLPNKSHGIR
ncbi:MAG: class I SAM-dependent methyltransferase [Lysobacterales bacterium]